MREVSPTKAHQSLLKHSLYTVGVRDLRAKVVCLMSHTSSVFLVLVTLGFVHQDRILC